MTTTFWIAAAVLVALALAFFVYPLVFGRPGERAETEIRNQNLLAYRSRLAELDAELENGQIDRETHQQLHDELSGAMLDDVGEESQEDLRGEDLRVDYRRTSTRLVVLATVLILPVSAVFLYQELGAMDRVEARLAMESADTGDDGDRAQRMSELARQLQERLEAEPDNAEGWAMLARTYMRLERYPEAARAFERLAGVVPDEQSRAVAWGLSAQAWFFDSEGAMSEPVTNAIERARALNPHEVNSLGLLGIHAFEQENFEDAIRYWERIIEMAPDHPQLPSIREGVAQAYRQLGRPVPELARKETVSSGERSERGVTVRVELDPAFADSVASDTTLFVYAREPDSNSAPLAVARLRAGDLPAVVRLDDGLAMAPQFRISQAREVTVAARLSPSASATPRPGDWQGVVEEPVPVDGGEDGEPVRLLIDRQLR